eukprot:scaffold100606_cov23-Cyclotella_meneghiniana.AAC.1
MTSSVTALCSHNPTTNNQPHRLHRSSSAHRTTPPPPQLTTNRPNGVSYEYRTTTQAKGVRSPCTVY